jgi:hypothetical protein
MMMRSRLFLLAVFLCVAVGFSRAAAADESREPSVRIALENVSLDSINSERVQLTASVSVASSRSVTLREATFGQLHINGIPFYAAPISDRLILVPNQKVMPSKPLLLTVYFRDLSSLKPLRSLVADSKVSVTGMAYANLDLNVAAKLLLFTSHPRVPVRVDSSVELRIPGGAAAKFAALAMIDHAQAGLDRAGPALQAGAQFFSQWKQQLWKEYAPALVLSRATYELKDSKGKTFQFESTAMGFRVAGKQVVLPKSLLQPWKFDPYVAASMKEDGSLKVSKYDLWLWPVNASLRDESGQLSSLHAWRLSAKQIRLLTPTKDDTEHLLLPIEDGKTVKISVHRRQGPAALGLVEIIDPAVPAMNPVLADPDRSTPPSTLALFRFPEGTDAREARPDLLIVSSQQPAKGGKLDTLIDSTGWGSPLISQQGIVGIITTEDSVVSIADADKTLRFSTDRQHTETGK